MIFITNHLQDNQPRCGCAIIVSDLSLSLRDKERFRDWEIERAWQLCFEAGTYQEGYIEELSTWFYLDTDFLNFWKCTIWNINIQYKNG